MPEPCSDPERSAADYSGQRWFAWVPGRAGAGPVPAGSLDWQALLEALAAGGLLDEDPGGQAVAEEQDAAADGRMSGPLPPPALGALAAEHMVPGPAQAGWLAAAATNPELDENALAGMAIAARQLASWAQAIELGAVAGLTACSAAADPDIGLKPDGRPVRLCRDAVGQVSLALMLTEHSATDWAGLAVTLAWRLPATAAALADGRIDLARAKVIAEATSVLAEHAARAVEAAVVPGAQTQTCAQLRARLRRAVIAADPEGAEQRRQEAERQAAVSLYGDDDGTATLTGTGLPAVQAAAAMARITAIARAMKAAGQGGGLDLRRAKVMLGLLLGTLPYIPPAGGSPEPPPPDASDPGPGSGAPSGRPDSRAPGAGPGGGRDNDGSRSRPGDWPALGARPPDLARPAAPAGGRPPAGLLDVTVPWVTLAGHSAAPGILGRIGPVTAAQARYLARTAETDPAARWRVIVANPAGQALAVARIPRRTRDGPTPPESHPPSSGLVGRITLTITQDTIRRHASARARPGGWTRPVCPTRPGRRDRRRRATSRGPGPGPRPGSGRSRHRGRRMRSHQRIARLRTAAAAARARHRAGCHLPPPRLPAACLARRPGSHPALGPRRAYLRLQPRRRLPPTPPAQAASPLDARPDPARPLHLDHPRRTPIHRHPRHPPGVARVGWAIMDGCRRS